MDGHLIGGIGGIGGSVVGVMGGIIGTWVSIKNAKGLKERAFMIRAATLCWLGVSAFLGCLFLLPMHWRWLLWAVYLPSLFWFIKWVNNRQARAKVEDMTEAGPPGGRVGGQGE